MDFHSVSHEQLHDNFGKARLHGEYVKKFHQNLTGECLRVRMHVVDSKNCIGNKTDLIISIPTIQNKLLIHDDNISMDYNNVT